MLAEIKRLGEFVTGKRELWNIKKFSRGFDLPGGKFLKETYDLDFVPDGCVEVIRGKNKDGNKRYRIDFERLIKPKD